MTSALVGERVLVTGGSGFIGSWLVEALLERGAEVHCLLRASSRAASCRAWAGVHAHYADLTDRAAVQGVVDAARPDAIVHLAAVGVQDVGVDPVAAIQVNVVGTLNLLQALQGHYRVFINVGTCLEYGSNDPPFREDQDPRPQLTYAISKTAAWRFCCRFHGTEGWPIITLRPFAVYGPRQPASAFIPLCIQAARQGQAFHMSPGDQTRDWVYVSDVIDGFLRALSTPQAVGSTINLCSGTELTLYHLAVTIATQIGSDTRIQRGAQPYRYGEIRRLVGDNSLARTVLGWAPRVSLAEGLQRTIEAMIQTDHCLGAARGRS